MKPCNAKEGAGPAAALTESLSKVRGAVVVGARRRGRGVQLYLEALECKGGGGAGGSVG